MLRCPKGTRKCHNNTCVSHNKSVDKQKFRCKKGTRKCLDNNCYSIINPSDILKPKILNPVKQLSTSELKKQIFAPYTSSSLKTQKSSIKPMTKKYNIPNFPSSNKSSPEKLSTSELKRQIFDPYTSSSLKTQKSSIKPISNIKQPSIPIFPNSTQSSIKLTPEKQFSSLTPNESLNEILNFSNLKSSTKNPSNILSDKTTYNKQIIPSYSPSLKSDKTILLPKIKTQNFNSRKNILKSSSSKPSSSIKSLRKSSSLSKPSSSVKSLRKSSSSKRSSRKISSNKNKTSSYKTPSSLKSFDINIPTSKSIKKTSSQSIKTPSTKSLSSLKKSSSTIKSISPI
jgi:hypothetical protein